MAYAAPIPSSPPVANAQNANYANTAGNTNTANNVINQANNVVQADTSTFGVSGGVGIYNGSPYTVEYFYDGSYCGGLYFSGTVTIDSGQNGYPTSPANCGDTTINHLYPLQIYY